MRIRVMMCPLSTSPYIKHLVKSLRDKGVKVTLIPWFGKQSLISFALLFTGILLGYRIIHLHWIPFNRCFLMKVLRRITDMMGIRMIWTIHNLVPHLTIYGSEEIDNEVMREMTDWAVEGIIHTESSISGFRSLYGEDLPVRVIPHGNFLDITKSVPRKEAREFFSIPDGRFVVFFLSPDRWEKGIESYLNVMDRLPARFLGLIAGRCGNKEIRKFIEKRTSGDKDRYKVLLGPIPRADLGYYYGSSDILFMPFERITTSASVIDAMGFKKAIVSTCKGDLKELIQNGVNGYLCSNEEEMYRSIISMDSKEAETMGEESYKIVKELDWENIAEKTRNLYIEAQTRESPRFAPSSERGALD